MAHLETWMQAVAGAARPRSPAATPVELDTERWREYFEQIAHDCAGVLATLEVRRRRPSAPSGQPLRELRTIGYRPADDVLELSVASPGGTAALRYFVAAPRRIQLGESDDGVELLVEDASGTATLIRLFNLPRAVAGGGSG